MPSLILDSLPSTEEFYSKYWNKKAFVIRSFIKDETLAKFIDEDHLAGLAMEDDVKSRIVLKGKDIKGWDCLHGPFTEEIFTELGDKDWSLLVQNIDQYHPKTAELLKYFNFTPRWLLDDIMVSYSPKGGTVGAHIDSYHVFLVQGKGEREWKIGHDLILEEEYVEDIPIKLLKNDFDGETVTIRSGDILYIPPRTAHYGVSLSPSITYSVGYLGPSLSELICEFGQYIEQNDSLNDRYYGSEVNENSSGFMIASEEADHIRSSLTSLIHSPSFTSWLCEYFALPNLEIPDESETAYMASYLKKLITDGAKVHKSCIQKMMFVPNAKSKSYHVQIGLVSFDLGFNDLPLLHHLASEEPFPMNEFTNHIDLLQELLSEKTILIL